MDLASLSFILTDACNYSCTYCYQKTDRRSLPLSAAKRAFDFFLPYLSTHFFVSFTGGEPLLSFEPMTALVTHMKKETRYKEKKIFFSLNTNGSQIDDTILSFLRRERFSILLSFDGYAQNITRKMGSFSPLVKIIKKILRAPEIKLKINCVVTPETVHHLSSSVRFISELGAQDIQISLPHLPPWSIQSRRKLKTELQALREPMTSLYRNTGNIPLHDLREVSSKGVFACYAGKDRMALSPDGALWGCHLFYHYFKGKEKEAEFHKYSFGDLDSFIQNHESGYSKIARNYSRLRMDNFRTDERLCLQCPEYLECVMCPIDMAYAGSKLGIIPVWKCALHGILKEERRLFRKEIGD